MARWSSLGCGCFWGRHRYASFAVDGIRVYRAAQEGVIWRCCYDRHGWMLYTVVCVCVCRSELVKIRTADILSPSFCRFGIVGYL